MCPAPQAVTPLLVWKVICRAAPNDSRWWGSPLNCGTGGKDTSVLGDFLASCDVSGANDLFGGVLQRIAGAPPTRTPRAELVKGEHSLAASLTAAPHPSPVCTAGSPAALPALAHLSWPTNLMQLALLRIMLPNGRWICLSCLESGVANTRLKHPIQHVFLSPHTLNCVCHWVSLHCFPL